MNAVLAAVLAVGTGVVVIAVAVAVVLLALIAALSLRGRQKRSATQRDQRAKTSMGPTNDRDGPNETATSPRNGQTVKLATSRSRPKRDRATRTMVR